MRPRYGEQVTTEVDHASATPYDCLAWSAIIFSTPVKDADEDGLPDGLEDNSGLKSPDGKPLPDLNAMGASSLHKDLFVEVGAMQAGPGTHYGPRSDDGRSQPPAHAGRAEDGGRRLQGRRAFGPISTSAPATVSPVRRSITPIIPRGPEAGN